MPCSQHENKSLIVLVSGLGGWRASSDSCAGWANSGRRELFRACREDGRHPGALDADAQIIWANNFIYAVHMA